MLEVITEDDEGDPAKTVSAFKKLTVQDKVKFIVGSLTSGCTKAITDQSQAMKVIQMAPAATAENIITHSLIYECGVILVFSFQF